jgi:hypothetical protein
MATQISIQQIDSQLQELPPEKLAVVYDFVSYLVARERAEQAEDRAWATMIASEAVLAREWDTPEEDEAWRHL